MKFGNALKATNVFSGKEFSLTDLGTIWSMILGVVVLFFVTATGQNLAKTVSSKIPMLDTQIDPIAQKASVQNNKLVY